VRQRFGERCPECEAAAQPAADAARFAGRGADAPLVGPDGPVSSSPGRTASTAAPAERREASPHGDELVR